MVHRHLRVMVLLILVTTAGIFLTVYWPIRNQSMTGHPRKTWKCQTCDADGRKFIEGARKKEKWVDKTERKSWAQDNLGGVMYNKQKTCSGGKTQKHLSASWRHTGFIGPFDYTPRSKNPCWNETWEGTAPQLYCLPYFFLAGVSKCGSTDIFSRLTEHPQVLLPRQKEPRWFDIRRYTKEKYSFDWYVANFEEAARRISLDIQRDGFSKRIVGDGTPTYFWRNYFWDHYPGNEGCDEPQVLTADFIHQLLPKAKLIISFRNPADSLYSKYLSYGDKGFSRSPSHFHSLVSKQIHQYQDCFSRFSVRRCAYNVTLSKGTEVRLEKGLYVVFLADWFRLFPKEQIHFVRFEDYVADVHNHLCKMFDFLELDAMPDTSLQKLASRPPANKGNHYNKGLMLPETRQLLERFYAPFNHRLAALLSDKRFLWLP